MIIINNKNKTQRHKGTENLFMNKISVLRVSVFRSTISKELYSAYNKLRSYGVLS